MPFLDAARELEALCGELGLPIHIQEDWLEHLIAQYATQPPVDNNQDIFYNKDENIIEVKGRVVECQREKEHALLADDNARNR